MRYVAALTALAILVANVWAYADDGKMFVAGATASAAVVGAAVVRGSWVLRGLVASGVTIGAFVFAFGLY
jgi:hypothetical protein